MTKLHEFNQLKQSLELTQAMTQKEFKARYKQAAFGLMWIILNPLLQMLIIGVIFSFFIDIPNYFLFLSSGLLLWQFFSLTINKTTPCFVFERSLLKKSNFPKAAIPLSIIFSNFIHLLISIVLLILALPLFHQPLTAQSLFLIPAIIWLLLLTIGVSLITSSLNVRFRDVAFFVQSIITLWFYATPILYSLKLIPSTLLPLFSLNPLTGIFELVHFSLFNQGSLEFHILIPNIIISMIIITAGIFIFKKENPYFVDWL